MDVIALERPDLRFPAMCKTWRCEYCGSRKARQKAAILAWARPERFITLTQAPDDWSALRKKVRVLKHELLGAGLRFEVAWTVEEGKETGMRHVHLLQHGDYVPQAQLQDRWGRIADVRAIRGARKAVDYAMKEAVQVSGYAMKGAADLDAHLDRNGGRGCHLSRGYLRGETQASVLDLLQRERSEGEILTWVLIRPGATFEALANGLLRAVETPPEMAQCSTIAPSLLGVR
jgi:hypothetical protein